MTNPRLLAFLRTFLPYAALIGAAVATVFLLHVPLAETPDGLIHAHRTRALADAFTQRVFLPRLFPDFAFGYGYPVLHYYAPLSYYPAAAANATGVGLEAAVLWGAGLFLALSAAAMFAFLRIWTTPFIAFAVAALSLYAPYRLYNLSVRGALPEYAAFAWLPLIGLALAKLLNLSEHRDADSAYPAQPDARYAALLVASCAGLILTHNLSAVMAALALAIAAVVYVIVLLLGRKATTSHLGRPVIALSFAVAGAALAAFYAVPALMELDWVGLGQSSDGSAALNHLANARQLFSASFPYAYPPAAQPTVSAPVLFLAVNLALAALLVVAKDTNLRTAAVVSLLLSAASLFLMSDLSAPLWTIGRPLLGKLQFPWRWHTILTFSSIWGLALVLEWIRRQTSRRTQPIVYGAIAVLAVAFIGYAVAAIPRTSQPLPADVLTTQAMWSFDESVGQVGASWTGEFLPRWVTEQRWAIGRAPSDAGAGAESPADSLAGAGATIRPLRAEYLDTTYSVTASEGFPLVFHTFYLPAWQVSVDGARASTRPVSNLALLSVDVPAGEHEVAVEWAATPWVRIGWAASAAAWLATLAFLLAARPRRTALAAAWAAIGVLVFALWLLPARAVQPAPIGADYGAVRLEAASVQDGRPGDIAHVDLTWFILDPVEPLSAFVHIVDEQGALVAQDDGPLAGAFTPFERWLPGMVVTRRHWVALPTELPPGTYTALVGVYPTDAPDATLSPQLDTDVNGAAAAVDANGRITVAAFDVAP